MYVHMLLKQDSIRAFFFTFLIYDTSVPNEILNPLKVVTDMAHISLLDCIFPFRPFFTREKRKFFCFLFVCLFFDWLVVVF